MAVQSKLVWKLSQEIKVSLGSAHMIVKEKWNLFLNKVEIPHDLKGADHVNRVQYCQLLKNLWQKMG